jgi:DNA polymerase I-like protein with 3'-5' exonuclease and polymerase domains
VDVETHDPQLTDLGSGARRGGRMVGVSFAIDGGPAHYLPFGHEAGDNLDEPTVLRYLLDQAARFRGELVGANLQYDLDYLLQSGIEFRPSWFRDVQVAEPLIDDLQFSYSLDNIVKRYDLIGKDEDLLKDAAVSWGLHPKKDLWKLPARYVGGYAERDVRLPLELFRLQEKRIDVEGLREVFNLESRLFPVLVAMTRRGIKVDLDRLDYVERWAREEQTKQLDRIKAETGIAIGLDDMAKAKALEPVLVHIGIEVPRTPKADLPSVTTALLEGAKHPIATALRDARRYWKIRTTFVESVRAHQVRGRIHAHFWQIRGSKEGARKADDEAGAMWGRLSCSDPNLQQQPGAKDLARGKVWRSIYVPDGGGLWACLDWKTQEPRWATHFAEQLGCRGAKEAADRFRSDPMTDPYLPVTVDFIGAGRWEGMSATERKVERDKIKQIYLGLLYGMGGAKLCHKLGFPTVWEDDPRNPGKKVERAGPQGVAMLQQFDRVAPYVRQAARIASDTAERLGYIQTISGRTCRFPIVTVDGKKKRDWVHKALNRAVQGSSGDQIKAAMVHAHEAGIALQLQVHDELDQTVADRKEAEALAEIMRTVAPCNVPHVVDIDIGKNWGEVTS